MGLLFEGRFADFRGLIPAQMQADRDMWQEGGKAQYTKHVKLLAKAYDICDSELQCPAYIYHSRCFRPRPG